MLSEPSRDRLGPCPGEVEVIEERSGRLVIPSSGVAITDDDVRALRDTVPQGAS